MPRPVTVTDIAILDAVGRAVARIGPHAVRLRDIADEAGLAAPTLVQRFGSKRALMAAFARHAGEAGETALADDGTGDPLARLEKGLVGELGATGDAEALAHHLARTHLELADPELLALAVRRSRRRRKAIRALLDRAVSEGRLVSRTRTGKLSRSLETTVQGALSTWAIHRRKSLRRWVRREIRAVLEPWLAH